MLRERDGDLAEFLKNDPKGREIPAYLEGLAEQCLADQQQVLTELDSLRKNINHIKDIVALQQRYGRLSGGREAVSVSELVENALQINAGTLDRHRIKIQSDFQADPTVTLEKHKVLQILVNLIRNAKYACDEGGRPEKLLIVRITGDSERARIAIIDNGAGISPENLTHIFTYGFTTRKDGHGFGLHSAALTAKELGGTLSVQSDGPGQGATFVLEIPYQPPGAAL